MTLLVSQEIENIIHGCVKLQRESQKQFYTYFYSYAMAICLRYAHSDDDAMEIANDGFLKIFKELSTFEARYEDVEASLKGWMKKIMVNTSIDHFRKNQKHQMNVSIDDKLFHLEDHAETSIDKLSYEEIIEAIKQLTPVYRTVFNLFAIEGMTHEEIATQLQISVGASKSNLSKARHNLRKIISHQTQYNTYVQTR